MEYFAVLFNIYCVSFQKN